MKKLRKYRFTLAEILVSMVVFSILLTIMMQFFSGARTLWTANEKRTAMYTDASVALDLMANLLQGTYCTLGPMASDPSKSENKTVFEIVQNNDKDKVYFVCNSPMELAGGGSVRYLSFQRGTDSSTDSLGATDNVLYLKIFSDKNYLLSNGKPLIANCFYEFVAPDSWPSGWGGPTVLNDLGEARAVVKYALDNIPVTDKTFVKPVLRNVTGLKFELLDRDGKKNASLGKTTPPAGIEITLTLMPDEAAVKAWQDMPESDEEKKELKKDFRLKNETVFHRTVWLNDRAYTR